MGIDRGSVNLRSAHRLKQGARIGDISRHGAQTDKLELEWVQLSWGRYATRRGAKSNDALKRGGCSEGAHHVAAISQRQHMTCQSRCGTAATAAGSETGIKGVSGQSMEAVLGMPTQPPLGHIGLANDDGTRCPDTRNVGVIFCRDE